MEHFDFLQNKAVTAVIFTKDSLQLELENATITCFRFPLILGASHDFEATHPDYKNQLVQLIGMPVLTVAIMENGLVIGFDNGELFFEADGGQELLIIADDNGEWHSYPDAFDAE